MCNGSSHTKNTCTHTHTHHAQGSGEPDYGPGDRGELGRQRHNRTVQEREHEGERCGLPASLLLHHQPRSTNSSSQPALSHDSVEWLVAWSQLDLAGVP